MSAVDALLLEYQYQKLKKRWELLHNEHANEVFPDKRADSKRVKRPGKIAYEQYETDIADASTWTDSLYDQRSGAYQNRLALAQALDGEDLSQERFYQYRLEAQRQQQEEEERSGAKKPQRAASDRSEHKENRRDDLVVPLEPEKIGLWFRLQWFFAGSTALLPNSNSVLLSLGIAVGLVLMVVSLAVMAQAGVLIAGTWVLGSTLTSAALWLAAQLSIAGLGLPALIALAVVGALIAMACITEWKFPGIFANVLFGFYPQGRDHTPIHRTKHLRDIFASYDDNFTTDKNIKMSPAANTSLKRRFNQFLNRFTEIFALLFGVNHSITKRWTIYLYILILPFAFLYWAVFQGLNKLALYFSPKSEGKPSHPLFAAFKWLLHLVFVVITLPLVALISVVDSLYLAARFVYRDATFSSKPAPVSEPPKARSPQYARPLGFVSAEVALGKSDAPPRMRRRKNREGSIDKDGKDIFYIVNNKDFDSLLGPTEFNSPSFSKFKATHSPQLT